MQELQNLEIFEIETLDFLNSIKILDHLYFGGETMLRLCHNLNRYSTDLDFWLKENIDSKAIFKKLKLSLSQRYKITDSANKRNTILFQFRKEGIRRSLKIEIRKGQSNFEWERKIAFSRFTNLQVKVQALTLEQMLRNKIEALLSHKIIRDAFDLQFLIMRGVELKADASTLTKILQILDGFKTRDFKVTLGSVLDESDRAFYSENRFNLLKEEINATLTKMKFK